MRLYHGSVKTVGQAVFGAGKLYNDYGRGFYCTENKEVAKEWAVDENVDGYLNIYDLDLSGLSLINLQSPEYCILHWLTVLLRNLYLRRSGIRSGPPATLRPVHNTAG